MANRTMQAKTLRMKQRALNAKLGDAKRWGDPRPAAKKPHNDTVAREIAVARKQQKALRRMGRHL